MPIDDGLDSGGLEPASDVVWIKAYALTPPKKRDPPLRYQPADVSVRHPEVVGKTRDVQEVRK